MHRKFPWWTYLLFFAGCGIVFWFSGGARPAY
jgi:hypothetical protein